MTDKQMEETVECERCDGWGVVEQISKCLHCDGTGYVTAKKPGQARVPGAMRQRADVTFCIYDPLMDVRYEYDEFLCATDKADELGCRVIQCQRAGSNPTACRKENERWPVSHERVLNAEGGQP